MLLAIAVQHRGHFLTKNSKLVGKWRLRDERSALRQLERPGGLNSVTSQVGSIRIEGRGRTRWHALSSETAKLYPPRRSARRGNLVLLGAQLVLSEPARPTSRDD